MSTYPEVYTNFSFVYIPTMSLKLRAGVEINTDNNEEAEDVVYEGSAIGSVCCANNLPQCRQHTSNQVLILE